MQGAVDVERACDRGFHRGTVCHVTGEEGGDPASGTDRLLDGFPFRRAAGQEGHVRPLLGEPVRRRFPNATIAPGDNRHFAL
jgi:hypothetical protein